MSIFAYLRYASVGVMLVAAASMNARAQSGTTAGAPGAASTTSSSTATAKQKSGDSVLTEAERAQLKQEMAKFREEIEAEAKEIRKQVDEEKKAAWAQEATAMAEAQRQKLRESIDAEAQKLRAEVEKEMAANELDDRAELGALSERARAEEAVAAARAKQAEAAAQAQAGQIFAIPPDQAELADDAGWLGIEIAEVTPEKEKEMKLSQLRGVIVTEVLPDGPGAKAGLQSNDVILEYDGHTVEGTLQFQRLVRETPPGRNVAVMVSRNGSESKVSVQVGDRARNIESRLRVVVPPRDFNFNFTMPDFFPGRTPALGIEAEDLNGQLGAYFHAPGDEGVLVRQVNPDTPAAKAGLKAGDVITRVDGTAVKNIGDLRDEMREKRDQKSVSLTIIRQGAAMAVTIAVEPPPAAPRIARSRTATL